MGRPLVASEVVRFVGEIVAIVVSDDRAAGVDAAELVAVDYDPLPAVVDPRVAGEGRGAALPGGRARTSPPAPARPTTTTTSSTAATSSSPARSSARGWRRARSSRARPPPRSAPDGRVTAWLCDADAAPGPAGHRRHARPRPGRRARRRPRRRRRLRREDAAHRGDPPRVAHPPPRPARALDGDAQREHGRAPPRPRRSGSTFTLGGTSDGKLAGVPARHVPGRRRVPRARLVPAELHRR